MIRHRLSLAERAFHLKNTPPFDTLEDQELMNISEVLSSWTVEKGESVLTSESPVNELIIVVGGHLVDSNSDSPLKIIGVKSLLSGTSAEQSLMAGSDGAHILKMEKGHFFTTIYECSGLLVAFMNLLDEQNYYFC